ncbi:ATP-binding protein [Corynebacterium sp. UMB10119B.1]|uniref:ATP-binding protein n=1 Tax=Corynebacterium sp. UMB10119B.1 TaxID=3050601 RepID=UPI00254BFCCC|nr:ATP-binding protein [Corynebacterium sp. UMB10119B]MDK8364081.1 ATP-binding protein [Corynebacterium sp. UMB10119B]
MMNTPRAWSFVEDLHLADVLVLDDFLTTPIDAATAHQLLNILAEREHRGSTIVTSQFTPDEWYKSIPDAVIAESILETPPGLENVRSRVLLFFAQALMERLLIIR